MNIVGTPWTVLSIAVTVLIQLLTAVFVYGKLTEKVATNTEHIRVLEGKVLDHSERIARVEVRFSGNFRPNGRERPQ